MSSSDALKPATGMSDKRGQVWAALTSFFLMWSFLYIVLVVFRPSWVCVAQQGCVDLTTSPLQLDQGRAFVVALIITLVVMLIVWVVGATAGSSRSA